jgi:hypothetical protein
MSGSRMSTASSSRPTGGCILGFGKHTESVPAVPEKLRSSGFQAINFVLTNDEAGDARRIAELKRAEYDGVAIGGDINGQDAVNFPATEATTVWFNRVLDIVHANAPGAKIILGRGAEDAFPPAHDRRDAGVRAPKAGALGDAGSGCRPVQCQVRQAPRFRTDPAAPGEST